MLRVLFSRVWYLSLFYISWLRNNIFLIYILLQIIIFLINIINFNTLLYTIELDWSFDDYSLSSDRGRPSGSYWDTVLNNDGGSSSGGNNQPGGGNPNNDGGNLPDFRHEYKTDRFANYLSRHVESNVSSGGCRSDGSVRTNVYYSEMGADIRAHHPDL